MLLLLLPLFATTHGKFYPCRSFIHIDWSTVFLFPEFGFLQWAGTYLVVISILGDF